MIRMMSLLNEYHVLVIQFPVKSYLTELRYQNNRMFPYYESFICRIQTRGLIEGRCVRKEYIDRRSKREKQKRTTKNAANKSAGAGSSDSSIRS